MGKLTHRPWGIHTLASMITGPGAATMLPDGRWVRAVPLPYFGSVKERLRAAWWVFTGRAYAVEWPEPGDLEYVLRPRATPPLMGSGHGS